MILAWCRNLGLSGEAGRVYIQDSDRRMMRCGVLKLQWNEEELHMDPEVKSQPSPERCSASWVRAPEAVSGSCLPSQGTELRLSATMSPPAKSPEPRLSGCLGGNWKTPCPAPPSITTSGLSWEAESVWILERTDHLGASGRLTVQPSARRPGAASARDRPSPHTGPARGSP